MKTIRFAVEGMSCAACAKGVAVTLRDMPGVATADVHLDLGAAIVMYRPERVSKKTLAREIESLGYEVIVPCE